MSYRIGIVGAGIIARTHAAAVRLLPHARLTGVMDHGSGKGQLIAPDTDTRRAVLALEDLAAWQIDRISHAELIQPAWRHRHNESAYDAMYAVVARTYEVPLLTADGPLTRAPELGIVVQNIRMA
jgi:predicted nucleic acid-binding protein